MFSGWRIGARPFAALAALTVGLAVAACGNQHPAQISTGVVTLASATAAPAPAPAVTLSFVVNLGKTYLRVPEPATATGHRLIGPGTVAIEAYRGTGSGVIHAKVAKRGMLRIILSCVGGGKLTLENRAGHVIKAVHPCKESRVHELAFLSTSRRSGTWRVRVRPATRWSIAAISTTT